LPLQTAGNGGEGNGSSRSRKSNQQKNINSKIVNSMPILEDANDSGQTCFELGMPN
jgi:hypothetical protein